MLGKEAPALCDKDYREMYCEIWDQNAYHYAKLDKEIKQMEKDKEKIRNKLIELSNGKNCKGNGVVLARQFRRGQIDYKAILATLDVDIDVELFRKATSESWRLDVA
jgi:DNA replication protein DnaC